MSNWSPVKPVTSGMTEFCNLVKPEIEEMAGKTFDVYTPVSFAYKPLVGGMDYAINVNVGNVCVHAMATETLPYGEKRTVLRIQHPKALTDPLKPF
ncbi:cystatin-B-like [Megalobrama amblycephala]|uniref:cystatin-B-like n=1 Tax=Megalobrama amblycephala TaxID=75352 RepID=UPI00201471F3|nr:cystatin-B-like [Megalobrama amblycephala]